MDDSQIIRAAQAFRDAVDRAGSQSAFQRRTGLIQQTCSAILGREGMIPPEYVLVTEREFGVSRHILRPDIFGADPAIQSDPPVAAVFPSSTASTVEAGTPIDHCDRGAGLQAETDA